MTRTATETRRQQGVVMVITLLAVVLLTALILFVLNLGTQVERRIAVQNTADATVVGGSVWVARTMNTVARNNIEMARMIGLINVLDAMPRSTAYALAEQTSFYEALDDQLSRGVSNSGPAYLRRQIESLLNGLLDELEDEIDQLETADDFFDEYDMAEVTYYDGPRGMGAFWRAMYAMDELNQTAMAELGDIARRTAVRAGQITFPSEESQAVAMMSPLQPTVPWQRGRFADFERPVRHGLLPTTVDDDETNRGPYDTLFGWRHVISQTVGGTWVPGRRQTAQGGRGGVPIGSGSGGGGGSGGRRVGGTTIVTGYRVWGMHHHLLDRVSGFAESRLRHSRLSMWVRNMSNAKLNYLWPGEETPDDDELARTIAPDWINSWSQAIDIARAERGRIRETGFFAIEIKSRYPMNHPNFMDDGTWALDDAGSQPRIVRVGGWMDPRTWPADQVTEHGWRDEWEYTVWYDNDIGIEPLIDAAGNEVAQPVYRIDHFYFAGINVGEPEEIMDPYDGFNPESSDAPAPTDLNHVLVRDTPASRRAYLTFFSMAQRNDNAASWPTAFRSNKPHEAIIAMAQAKVFNNHSWDLWTPMWHARLEPISELDQWAAKLEADQAVLAEAIEIENADYLELESYLNHTIQLADIMLGH